MKNLTVEHVPQVAWYKQIKDEISKGHRIIDQYSIKDIDDMYRDKMFICDLCGACIDGSNFSLSDHIIHLINPMVHWSCDNCIGRDLKNGVIIAASEVVQGGTQKNYTDGKSTL